MKRIDKLNWYAKEFDNIHKEIKNKENLSHFDFLRIRNFKLQNSTTENEQNIKKITSNAFKLAKEDKIKEAIKELLKLNGVAIPIASTILAMKFPDKYAIIDIRVLKSLNKSEWIEKNKYIKDLQIYEDYILFMRKNKPLNLSLRKYEMNLFEGKL